MQQPAIGIIGGSGLYQLEGLTDPDEHVIDTPFGPPSDTIFGGRFSGRQVFFYRVTAADTASCRMS